MMVNSSSTGNGNHPSANDCWNHRSIAAAAVLCLGTAISALCFQHVSNAAPQYYFAIAVCSPLFGFVTYSSMVAAGHWTELRPSQLTLRGVWSALRYSAVIGTCFALTNILTDYGRSGSAAGVPDVSTVLSLILLKLVVPVSLALESLLDKRHPTCNELSGVGILLVGIILTGLINTTTGDDTATFTASKSRYYPIKVFCLCLASLPLSLGYYVVKVAREKLPLTGAELWAILSIPELLFSLFLAYAGHQNSSDLTDGFMCVLAGRSNNNSEKNTNNCQEAAIFFWLGLPFAFAFNLAIPILIQSKGSTSVPLFRALALPLSTLMAMTPIDRVIHSPFSWNAVMGVIASTAGLLIFYGNDVQKLLPPLLLRARRHYSTVTINRNEYESVLDNDNEQDESEGQNQAQGEDQDAEDA